MPPERFRIVAEAVVDRHRVVRDERGGMKRASVRAVNSIDGNLEVNRGLWILAEEMAKIKAAA